MIRRVAIAMLLAATSLAPVARADDTERPWVRGVSKELKARAQALLEQGNVEFLQNRHKEALAFYEQALAAWDHPAIRFNAVRALVALDRPLAAQEYLEKALAYGPEPLEDAVYREALNYRRLLAAMIGELEVRCDQRGVVVRVDGAVFATCPSVQTRRMTPGKHTVIATGDGLTALTTDAVVTPGKREQLGVELAPQGNLVAQPRWTPWKPWAVVAGGAVAVGVGVVFRVRAQTGSDEIEVIVRDRCQASCTPDQYGLSDRQQGVDRDNGIWVTGLAIGTTAIAAGLTLVILNRPQVRVHRASVVATHSTNGELGLAITGSF